LAYEKFRKKIVNLQSDWGKFKVEFLDRIAFKRFADNLFYEVKDFKEIYVTGYFSETVRDSLSKLAKIRNHNVKLISPEFSVRSKRDERNLQALKKLTSIRVAVKFNNRLHARLLVAYTPAFLEQGGLLIVGSFDFNTECIGLERHDAGIITKHPDLVKSAIELFEQIWNEPESILLEEFIKK